MYSTSLDFILPVDSSNSSLCSCFAQFDENLKLFFIRRVIPASVKILSYKNNTFETWTRITQHRRQANTYFAFTAIVSLLPRTNRCCEKNGIYSLMPSSVGQKQIHLVFVLQIATTSKISAFNNVFVSYMKWHPQTLRNLQRCHGLPPPLKQYLMKLAIMNISITHFPIKDLSMYFAYIPYWKVKSNKCSIKYWYSLLTFVKTKSIIRLEYLRGEPLLKRQNL